MATELANAAFANHIAFVTENIRKERERRDNAERARQERGPITHKRRSQAEFIQAVQWHKAGLSYAEIGRRLGVCRDRGKQICVKGERLLTNKRRHVNVVKAAYLRDLRHSCIAVPTEVG